MALKVNSKVLVGICWVKRAVYLMMLFSLQLPSRHEIGSGPPTVRISNLLISYLLVKIEMWLSKLLQKEMKVLGS